MDRRVRSVPTLVLGVVSLAIGLAVVVADSTSLAFGSTASVAALAGGLIVLVAVLFAPDSDANTDAAPVAEGNPKSGDPLRKDDAEDPLLADETGDVAEEPVD